MDSIWYNFNKNTKVTRPNKDNTDGINREKELGFKANEKARYEDFYTNYPEKENIRVSTAIYIIEYVYDEPVPKFKWKIQSDTTNILGYKCLKATTTFRGRNYEVWFTPFIPIRQGPWKFGGLPALILKAVDTKRYFEWTATGIEKVQNKNIYTYNFDKTNTQKTIRKDVINLLHKRWKDPAGLKFYLRPNLQRFSYKEKATGKIVTIERGDAYNYQGTYVPIPELE